MKEEPRHFKNFSEIASRSNFDSEASITLTNFQSLIGPYDFDDEVKCQVYKSDGNCGHKHLHGWLGKTKEGKEILIGGLCASKYFNADKRFASERNRVRSELNVKSYLEKLGELLADKKKFDKDVEAEINRLKYVRDSIRSISDSLPQSVLSILRDMSKTGNRAVSIQIQYIEKDEKGREISDWIDQNIGSVAGVAIWESSRILETYRELKGIQKVAQSVEISKEAGERKLKTWLNTLSELPRCISKIDDLEKDFENFSTFENIRSLCYLVSNHIEQEQIAQYSLRYNDIDTPSLSQGKELLKKMNAEIRNAVENRNFRVR